MTFEDPTDLVRCIKSDCQQYRAGGTPLCAAHLREQEKAAGATSISEPELEARVAAIRTEDDEHPGMVKVYDRETGEPSWVPVEPARLYVGPDPDTVNISEVLRLDVPTWNQRVGIDPPGPPPDPSSVEPVWQPAPGGGQWVLRPKERGVDLTAVRSLVRDLMHVLGIREEGGDDHA